MELLSLAREALQTAAERAASYRLGQSALRYMDRALWVVEKSARWAVPPPLDQDERPQPELVRPLPWVPFLALLVALRVTREAISLLNLALGKPPLRSADVVTYIQGKRRYLRTLKYQGNRLMRARSEGGARGSWYSHVQTLFEFTMCFRRQHYGNNNTQLNNGDEVFVVKRNKRPRQEANSAAATGETSMERLIEKMMVDVDVDSDESSSYTFTNITSGRSDKSDYNTESDQETNTNTEMDRQNNDTLERHDVTPEENTVSTGDDNIKDESADSFKSKEDLTESNQLNDKTLDSNQTKEKSLDPNESKENTIDSCQSNDTSFESNELKDTSTDSDQTEKLTDSKQSNENSIDSHQPKENSIDSSQSNESKDTSTNSDQLTEKLTDFKQSNENSIDSHQPKENSIDSNQSEDKTNISLTRLERTYDSEEDSDTKEATINFIQSEIGSRVSGNGNNHFKIENGRISRDLTATER